MNTALNCNGTTEYRVYKSYKTFSSDTAYASVTYVCSDTISIISNEKFICAKDPVDLSVSSKHSSEYTWWVKYEGETDF